MGQYLLESNPAFILLKNKDNDYVFYNSINHRAYVLSELELDILELIYTYNDKETILSHFNLEQRALVEEAFERVNTLKLLDCTQPAFVSPLNSTLPSSFYLHLTYRCNLRCAYCYNREIRKGYKKDLRFEDWKIIINKIIEHASSITLTGGECFLFDGIETIVRYIKKEKPDIKITCISNGMSDFRTTKLTELFRDIDSIMLSCDSAFDVGYRTGFDPLRYRNNIEFIRTEFPDVKVDISATLTHANADDLIKTKHFCFERGCSFNTVVLLPTNHRQIDLMPSISKIDEMSDSVFDAEKTVLQAPRLRCGAGKEILSIDPEGKVYPCQSLHYDEFLMGNLLTDNLDSIVKVQSSKDFFPSLEDLQVCNKCKVKYICGGGCLASGYDLYHKLDRNHLTCILNYKNCIAKLQSLVKNR